MKTHPKISTITHQFWKTPKPRFQNMKCMNNKRKEAYQVRKNLKKPWGSRLEWDESVWERKRESYRERDRRKWVTDRMRRLYRPSVNLDRCRCREVFRQLSRKVSRKWSSTDTSIEEVSRNNPSDARIEARSIHQLSRSYRGGRSFLDLSTRYREAIEIAIWKSLGSLTDS